jgi:allantoicase
MTVTHLRVHIFPHGGVNRLRVFGSAVDTQAEARVLAALHAMPAADAAELHRSFCGSRAWADTLAAQRPFADVRSWFAAAERSFWALDTTAWMEAFAAHPRIGEQKASATQNAQSASWSAGEQRKAQAAAAATQERLATLNQEYSDKFGFIYIVFATGKTADMMLEILASRIGNSRDAEIENAAREQAKITRLRMEKWLRAAVMNT